MPMVQLIINDSLVLQLFSVFLSQTLRRQNVSKPEINVNPQVHYINLHNESYFLLAPSSLLFILLQYTTHKTIN